MALENSLETWQEFETKQQMVQIVHSASAYLLASHLQSPRGNAHSHKLVLPPMLPCNPPNPVVEPIVSLFPLADFLLVAVEFAASLPMHLQLAAPPQSLDFVLVKVHPTQPLFVAFAALPALAATIVVAVFLATPNSELLGTFAPQHRGVQSLPVDLAAGS